MKQAQLKISVHIHAIRLKVKFPCSISASLKTENQELPYPQEAPLRMGEATFDQKISNQIILLYDPSRKSFEDKRISVLLFLKSSSGRIPAGSVSLNINEIVNGVERRNVAIEKCPDKDARIEMTVNCEIPNQLDFNPGETNKRQKSQSSQRNKRITFGVVGDTRGLKGSMMEQSAYRKKSNFQDNDYCVPKSNKEINQMARFEAKTELQNSTSGFKEEFETVSNRSPYQFTDYSTKSKMTNLERELKSIQSKYEQQNMQLKNISGMKQILEKSLKDAEYQVRSYKQKYEDTKLENQNLLKKNEYRDHSLKEQIRIISQKLAASESDRQKMMFQRNQMMNGFEEREKDLRIGLREKEKNIQEENFKLSKKLDKVTEELSSIKYQQKDCLQKEQQLRIELKNQANRCENLENTISQLQSDIRLLKTELSEEKAQRSQLQQMISANTELEEEKKKFRKKVGELQLEIAGLLKNNASSEANAQKYSRKCEQLQESLKQKLNILKNLQKETESLSNEGLLMKSTIQEQQRKLEQFSNLKQKENQKLEGVIKDLNQNIKRLQEEVKTNQSELKYKDNVINGLKEQMENDHQDIESLNKKCSLLDIELSQQKTNLTKLKFELQQLTSEKEKLEIEKSELEVQIDSYTQELQNIEKQRKHEHSEREDEKRQYQTRIKNLEYSLQHTNEQSTFKFQQLQRKFEELVRESQAKSEEITSLQFCITSLQEEKAKGQKINEQILYSLNLKEKEAAFLNQSLEKAHQDINSSLTENKKLEKQIQSLKKTNEELQQDIEGLNQELSNVTFSGSNARQQMIDYKARNIEHISRFLASIKGGIIDFNSQHEETVVVKMIESAVKRNNQYITESDSSLKQLQNQQEQLRIDYQALREQLKTMQEIQEETSVKLKETSDLLTKQLSINTNLEEKIRKLETDLSRQEETSSGQGAKMKKQIQDLKNTKQDLQSKLKDKTNKNNQLEKNLSTMSRQFKQQEDDIEKKKKEIEAKSSTILRYGQIEKQLRNQLKEANKQINSLKDVNENIRKRNQKGTVREKQLEDQLNTLKDRFTALVKKQNQLQKTHHTTNNELNTLRNSHNKLDMEHKKARAQLQASKNMVKVKDDLLLKSQNQIKALQNHKKILQSECNQNNKQIQRLSKVYTDLETVKNSLENQITILAKTMNQKEKTHNLDNQYLKPIRENIADLKGYINEYSKVADQFESNKNKLLKVAAGRLEQYTDKNVADKLRDVSLVFQKLKAFLLTGAGFNQKQKEAISEEIKKVQSALDRSLRGDR